MLSRSTDTMCMTGDQCLESICPHSILFSREDNFIIRSFDSARYTSNGLLILPLLAFMFQPHFVLLCLAICMLNYHSNYSKHPLYWNIQSRGWHFSRISQNSPWGNQSCLSTKQEWSPDNLLSASAQQWMWLHVLWWCRQDVSCSKTLLCESGHSPLSGLSRWVWKGQTSIYFPWSKLVSGDEECLFPLHTKLSQNCCPRWQKQTREDISLSNWPLPTCSTMIEKKKPNKTKKQQTFIWWTR